MAGKDLARDVNDGLNLDHKPYILLCRLLDEEGREGAFRILTAVRDGLSALNQLDYRCLGL